MRAKEHKTIADWIEIAWGVHFLHDLLYDLTDLEEDDDPRFMRDPKYRAGLEKAAAKYPGVAALIKNSATRNDLEWLRYNANSVSRWVNCQSDIKAKLKDTTPRAIRQLYARLDGANWAPTEEQLAKLVALEEKEDIERISRGDEYSMDGSSDEGSFDSDDILPD